MKALLAMRKWYVFVLMLGLWLPNQALGQAVACSTANPQNCAYVSTFGGNQILAVDRSSGATTVLKTDTGESLLAFQPEGIVVGPDNKIYIGDADGNRIWRLSQDGTVFEKVYDFSLTSASQCAGAACPQGSEAPSFNTKGDLYFNTRSPTHTGVWKIPAAQLSPIPAGGATPVNVVTAAQTGSTFGEGTTSDATDQLLFVDRSGGNVWRFNTATSTLVTPALITGLNTPVGIAVNSAGDIFVANNGTSSVKHYDTNGNPASVPDFVTFAAPDSPTFLKFDASGNLFVVTVQAGDASGGKVWSVDPSGVKTLVVALSTVSGLASNKALGIALPATTFTTAKLAVAPGTTITFTNGNIINQAVQIPPDANTNNVATMEMIFMQFAPAVFNSTRLTGAAGNTWSGATGSNTGPFSSTNAACTPIAGTGGNCMVMEGKCFDSTGTALATCNIQSVTTFIQLTSHYKTQSSQSNPGFLIADDGQNNWTNIADAYDPSDPTITGGTKGTQMDTAIVNLSGTLLADNTPPTVTATTFPLPNGAGWNNTSPVSAILTATDDQLVNNITYSATGAQTIASTKVLNASTFFPIANQGSTTVSFTAADNANNTTSGTLTVKIDTTPPTISITSPTSGATYTLNQAQAAGYTCTDLVSGVASCAGPVANGANIDTASIASKTFTVNSSDVAGNSATSSVNYFVAYGVCLLYDPTHAVKSGATIPLKIYLCDANGVDLSNSATIVNAGSLVQMSSGTTDTIVDAGNSNPDNNFRFDSTLGPSGGNIFNLKTTGLASGTYNLHFTAGADTTDHILVFQVK